MNDLLTNPTLHSLIVGAIVSLGVWFVKRYIQRGESQIESRFAAIEKQLQSTVKKEELTLLRRDSDRRHEENREVQSEIKELVKAMDSRLYELVKSLGSLPRKIN